MAGVPSSDSIHEKEIKTAKDLPMGGRVNHDGIMAVYCKRETPAQVSINA